MEFAYGKGCEDCNFTGFRGRLALAEVMHLDERVKELILEGASTSVLQDAVRSGGMESLREVGLRAIYDGLTSVAEVLRETFHGM